MELMATGTYNWIIMWPLLRAASEAFQTLRRHVFGWPGPEVQAHVFWESSPQGPLLHECSFGVALTALCGFQSTFSLHASAWWDCLHIVKCRVTFLNLLPGLLVGHSLLLVRHSLLLLPSGTPHASALLLTTVTAIAQSLTGFFPSTSSGCQWAPGFSPCTSSLPLGGFIGSHGFPCLLMKTRWIPHFYLQLQFASEL